MSHRSRTWCDWTNVTYGHPCMDGIYMDMHHVPIGRDNLVLREGEGGVLRAYTVPPDFPPLFQLSLSEFFVNFLTTPRRVRIGCSFCFACDLFLVAPSKGDYTRRQR